MADFNRTKPHMNIGTLGHIDHGKTTFVRGILKAFTADAGDADKMIDKLDKDPESRAKSITVALAHVEFETDKRHYALPRAGRNGRRIDRKIRRTFLYAH